MNKINDENRLIQVSDIKKVLLENPKPELKLPGLTITHLKKRRKKILKIFLICLAFFMIAVGSTLRYYFVNIEPVDSNSNEAVMVEIKYGETQREIATKLEKAGLIKNSLIFNIYTQITGTKNELKAGIYKLFKHDNLPTTVDKLVSGRGTEISIMFVPGATLMDNQAVLEKNGFSKEDISAAFNKYYDKRLLQIRPEGNDVEGFIYGDTYSFPSQASVDSILERTFDELQSEIDKNDLINKFDKQGLSLYEGLTLASIVQSEVTPPKGTIPSIDQKTVAGIFFNRLRIGMLLGSDVTYQYIADKLGITRDTNLDNPYNTRKYAGLPPGPISSPGLTALLAVAEPIATDYLFFLSGDDGTMRYSVDNVGHQSNIAKYCVTKCKII